MTTGSGLVELDGSSHHGGMDTTISIDAQEPSPAIPSRRGRRYGGLTVGLACALGLAVGLLIGFVRPQPQVPVHTVSVQAGLSEYPAQAIAAWWDTNGHRSTLDPGAANPVRLPAAQVMVFVVNTDGPVQCSITINGVVADTQSAMVQGQAALCSWTAPRS